MNAINSITNITPKTFLATAMFAADSKEARYYLRGVLVERAQDGGLLYTATNGHVLIHAHDANAEMDGSSPRIVETCNTKFSPIWWRAISLVHQGDGNTATLGLLGAARPQIASAPTIDGKFPDYAMVMPSSSPSGEPAQFDAKYINLFQIAAEKANFGRPYIHHNGLAGALVTFDNSTATVPAFGVIMPRRTAKTERPALPAAKND